MESESVAFHAIPVGSEVTCKPAATLVVRRCRSNRPTADSSTSADLDQPWDMRLAQDEVHLCATETI